LKNPIIFWQPDGEYGKQKKWWIHFLDEKKARPMEIKRNGGFAFG